MPGEFVGYDAEIKKIEKAISRFSSGSAVNIAIISEPYAGKTTLMEFMYHRFPVISTKITVPPYGDSLRGFEDALESELKQIVFIDDCHLLYKRSVGGFEALESFLDQIATKPEHMFITSWNIFSWKYLSEVMHIEKHFPCRISLPEFEVDEIRSVLMSSPEASEVIFDSGETGKLEHFLEFRKYPLRIKRLERTINIPFLKLNYSFLKEKLQQAEKESTTEDLAFIKIKDISSGNILLSKIIWQKSLHNSTIKVSEIYSPSFKAEFDYDTTFLAFMILSMGGLSKDSLEDAIGDEVDFIRSLSILQEHDMIEVKNGICSIKPEAMHYIESLARDARMI
ncbi:MAG: hypothetical protein SCH66_12145 [Methanolobus sp.]|nr:hypothetical protein [Methanolobus sp.]